MEALHENMGLCTIAASRGVWFLSPLKFAIFAPFPLTLCSFAWPIGGGLGGTRRGGADVNIRHSGRDDTSRYDER